MTTVARPLAAPNTTLPGLALSILTASLGISIVMVALPRLSEAFATSIAASQWVVLSFILASTVASVIIGRLADVAGRRRLLAGCLLLFAGASVLAFAASNLAVLLIARGIQGVAAAGMMALPMALIRDLLPPERSGTAMGVLGSTSAIGTALGPSVGGLLLGQYGWRSVFLVLVPMALGTLLLLMRSLPQDVPSARRSGGLLGDPAGTLLLAVLRRVIYLITCGSCCGRSGAARFGRPMFTGPYAVRSAEVGDLLVGWRCDGLTRVPPAGSHASGVVQKEKEQARHARHAVPGTRRLAAGARP